MADGESFKQFIWLRFFMTYPAIVFYKTVSTNGKSNLIWRKILEKGDPKIIAKVMFV